MARGDLSDTQYARIKRHLPTNEGKRGSPWSDHRRVINGILWILRTGAPWRDLPERYGPYTTGHDRLLRWQRDGTWKRIMQAFQSEAEADGTLDWEEGALDATVVKAHQHAAGASPSPTDAQKGGLQRPKGRRKGSIRRGTLKGRLRDQGKRKRSVAAGEG